MNVPLRLSTNPVSALVPVALLIVFSTGAITAEADALARVAALEVHGIRCGWASCGGLVSLCKPLSDGLIEKTPVVAFAECDTCGLLCQSCAEKHQLESYTFKVPHRYKRRGLRRPGPTCVPKFEPAQSKESDNKKEKETGSKSDQNAGATPSRLLIPPCF
jgi:hypothetical protein